MYIWQGEYLKERLLPRSRNGTGVDATKEEARKAFYYYGLTMVYTLLLFGQQPSTWVLGIHDMVHTLAGVD